MTLTFTDYLVYSVLGMCVVFFALILLMLIIKVITATVKEEEKPSPNKEGRPDSSVTAPLKTPVPAPGSAGDVNLYGTDPKTAAMIMAIVADELKTPLNELRFISIREVKQ